MTLRMHQFAPCSTANGPGSRAVIWVQGCALHCPGCFNPETHDAGGGTDIDPLELARRINALPVRGITLSGGEPLAQPEALLVLLGALDAGKDVLIYSGLSVAEAIRSPRRRRVLLGCDAALMGRYQHGSRHPYDGKELLIRTGRISPDELRPHHTVEIIVDGPQGLLTGFPAGQGK